jgi:DNA-binding response OmpR family regulator
MSILLVEDDRKAAGLLVKGLHEEGYAVSVVNSAEEAALYLANSACKLIILDWCLPGKSGLNLCAELRRKADSTPIMMLTARDALQDRVAGLNAGADDYLSKPFAFEELLARTQALLRRAELFRPKLLQIADLQLDPQAHHVSRASQTLELTQKEFAILELLLHNRGEVVNRAQIAEQVWTNDRMGLDNLIDAHVSNLRRKVDRPGLPPLLQTVRGHGFRLTEVKI